MFRSFPCPYIIYTQPQRLSHLLPITPLRMRVRFIVCFQLANLLTCESSAVPPFAGSPAVTGVFLCIVTGNWRTGVVGIVRAWLALRVVYTCCALHGLEKEQNDGFDVINDLVQVRRPILKHSKNYMRAFFPLLFRQNPTPENHAKLNSQLEFPVISGQHIISKYRSLNMSSYIAIFFMWNQISACFIFT
jgi:hypothetical protein